MSRWNSWAAAGRMGVLCVGLLLIAALSPAALAHSASTGAGWQKVQATGAVQGLDGRSHTATCSGYPGTDAKFNFWTRKGKSRNLVIYLEGGGACWDDLTCTFPYDSRLPTGVPQFYSAAMASSEKPAQLGGLFNLNRSDNPVKDWDMVYVPYCTGDLHSGTTTGTYINAGHPAYQHLPGQFDIRHQGFSNLMVVLDWVKRNVQAPARVLVAGSSAGGYGASINFPWVRTLFPAAQMRVLADASQGVTTPNWDQGTPGRGSWQVQLPPWAINMNPAAVSGPELLRLAAQAHPDVRVAQFSTNFDLEQVQFYGVMKEYYGPGSACPYPVLDWNRQMVSTMRSYAQTLPNYRHYLAAGTYHTILTGNDFYTERTFGVAFNDWLGAMVAADADQPWRWRNVACLGCLIQLPCPTP
ncbi:MAG: hypothetical protein IPH51_08080 [Rubrivivax sp.]|nr:hypothetical protein [Rubrivivax sp.]MBK8527959.1 hypothetical protein [Rubrivivax sp.]